MILYMNTIFIIEAYFRINFTCDKYREVNLNYIYWMDNIECIIFFSPIRFPLYSEQFTTRQSVCAKATFISWPAQNTSHF